jgi:hypothetical protein
MVEVKRRHGAAPVFPLTEEESKRKIQRYKWLDPGEEGTFMRLPIDKLEVDHSYQRDRQLHEVVLDRVAREWSWPLCEVITVARRPDGSYYVVNGQGRVIAAKKRGDFAKLPCMIFEMKGPEEEAATFARGQRTRVGLKAAEGYRADLRARDPNAVAIEKMLSAVGYEVQFTTGTNRRRTVRCIGALRRLYAANPKACERMFQLCIAITKGGQIRDGLLQGLFYIEAALEAKRTGKSLLQVDYHDKLLKIGEEELWEEIGKSARYWKKGGPKQYALGILKALNKGWGEDNKKRVEINAS